jgi:hypothetical protein
VLRCRKRAEGHNRTNYGLYFRLEPPSRSVVSSNLKARDAPHDFRALSTVVTVTVTVTVGASWVIEIDKPGVSESAPV